jgi:hypothetical protein
VSEKSGTKGIIRGENNEMRNRIKFLWSFQKFKVRRKNKFVKWIVQKFVDWNFKLYDFQKEIEKEHIGCELVRDENNFLMPKSACQCDECKGEKNGRI